MLQVREGTRRRGRAKGGHGAERYGAATSAAARHGDVRAAVAVAGASTATPATVLLPPACGEVVVKRGVQGWPQFDKCATQYSD